jgi:hypothetical protein
MASDDPDYHWVREAWSGEAREERVAMTTTEAAVRVRTYTRFAGGFTAMSPLGWPSSGCPPRS